MQFQQPPKRDGRAIASMILGICSLVLPIGGLATAIIGLILGLNVLKTNPHDGMAKAGKVMCIISLCIYGLMVIIPLLFFVIPALFVGLLGLIGAVFSV